MNAEVLHVIARFYADAELFAYFQRFDVGPLLVCYVYCDGERRGEEALSLHHSGNSWLLAEQEGFVVYCCITY